MWKKITQNASTFPKARSSHVTTICNGKLYVFGGEDTPRHPFSSNVAVYDPQAQAWNEISDATGDIPEPILAHTGAPVNGKIFYFGGRNAEKNDLNKLYSFDTVSQAWTQIYAINAPQVRSYHTSCSIGSKVYVFGGCSGKDRLNDLYEFDTVTQVWTQLDAGTGPCIRGGSTLAGVQDKLIVFGGFKHPNQLGDVWYFDLQTKTWSEPKCSGMAPSPRSVLVSCVVGDSVFYFGGEKEASAQGHDGAGKYFCESYVLNTKTNVWTQVVQSGAVPSSRGWMTADAYLHSDGAYRVLMFGGFDGITGTDRNNDLFECTIKL